MALPALPALVEDSTTSPVDPDAPAPPLMAPVPPLMAPPMVPLTAPPTLLATALATVVHTVATTFATMMLVTIVVIVSAAACASTIVMNWGGRRQSHLPTAADALPRFSVALSLVLLMLCRK